MYQIIKKSLTSKKFYSTEFKSVSRAKTVAFVFLISFIFAVFTSPIATVKSYKGFLNLKEQVLDLPLDLNLSYNSSNGLQTNISTPIVFEIEKDNLLVIDPSANYKPNGSSLGEVVFRNKGYMVYKNGDLVSQTSYEFPSFFNFSVTSNYIKNEFTNISPTYLLSVLSIITLVGNFLVAVLNIFSVALMFGSMSFFVNKVFLKSSDTLMQNYKKMLFLGIFFLIGTSINMVIGSTYAVFDVIVLGIGYFWLVR